MCALRSAMVAKSVVMLAALSTRVSAFFVPSLSRTGHLTPVRRVTGNAKTSLAAAVDARPDISTAVSSVVPEAATDTPSVKSGFLKKMIERGFYHQCTNVEGLDEKLATGEVVKAYLGFDATADRCVRCSLTSVACDVRRDVFR